MICRTNNDFFLIYQYSFCFLIYKSEILDCYFIICFSVILFNFAVVKLNIDNIMRKLSFLLFSLLFALSSIAKDISQAQAQRLAEAFMKRSGGAMRAPSVTGAQLKHVYTAVESSGQNSFYTFNVGSDNGYVIVSADDRAYQILGYSDSGSFEYNNLSPEMKGWLESYSEQISYIRKNNLPVAKAETENLGRYVAPLLGDIKWSQDAPYNEMCPAYDINTRCATGCVATAMAQVMYYNRWPEKGRGSNTYSPSILGGMPLTADFGNTTYDWNNMLPTYNSASSKVSRDAVALLMLHCGVSVNMEYYSSSGAGSEPVAPALFNYFNYDKGIAYRTRDRYSNAEWESIIRNELDNGRPMVALGRSSAGGHAFVFDGYDENGLVHVNWGWAGMSNGYFRTTALTPAMQGIGGANGGYNYDQYLITGIQPPAEDTEADVELVSTEGLVPSKMAINNGEKVDFRLCGMIANVGWQDSDAEFGFMLTDDNGNIIRVVETGISGMLQKGYQYSMEPFKDITFGNLEPGRYTLALVCRVTGGRGSWSRVRDEYIGYPNYIYVTVEDGQQKFSYPEYFKLAVDNLDVPETVYSSLMTKTGATIVNNGDVDYFGEVAISIVDKATKRSVATGDTYKIDLKPGSSIDVSMVNIFNLKPGDYSLTIVDDDNRRICEYRDITVKAAPDEAAVVEVAGQLSFADNENVDKNAMDITAEVTCSNGVYGGYLYLFFFNESGAVQEGCLDPQYLFLNEGETAEVHFSGPFENGIPGKTYVACLMLYDGTYYSFMTPREKSVCVFKLGGTTGIGGVTKADETPAKVYDINGLQLSVDGTGTLGKGVYIIKKGNKTVKVVK